MVKKWKSIMEMAFSLVLNYWEKEEGWKSLNYFTFPPKLIFMNYYDKCINLYIVGVRSLRWNGILVWGVLGELVIYLGSILAWLIVCCDAGESVYFWEELMKEIIDREKEREKEESKSLFWFVSCEHNLFLK